MSLRNPAPGRLIALLALLAGLPQSLRPQDPVPSDTVAGRVTARDSSPIPQAAVRLTAEDGREQATVTDSAGRYLLVVPGGSGSYTLAASAFGYLPLSAIVVKNPGSHRLTRDLRLSARPVVLETVAVVAKTARPPERSTPAERAERWDSFLVDRHPLDPGDFADVGSLLHGVARSGDGLSVIGQPPEQNGTTVDGAHFGGGSLPAEGVRSVGVFGSTYDVSRGRFSAGQIAARTIGGTNRWGGAASGDIDDPALRYGGTPAGLARGRSVRASGGGGGALARDRLFVYGAANVSRSRSAAIGFERLDESELRALSVDPDSARRFLAIARGLGLSPPDAGPPGESGSDAASGFGRLDYVLGRHGSLTLRLDGRASDLRGLGASRYRIGTDASGWRSWDRGFFLEHTGGWGRVSNVLRLYHSAGRSHMARERPVPAGVVRVGSGPGDHPPASVHLSFGDAAGFPSEGRRLVELGDDLMLFTRGGHQVKAGFLLQEERASTTPPPSAGIFTFDGLEDLERGRPVSFTRTLAEGTGEGVRRYAAVYLGDSWTPGSGPALIYGLRLEGTRYGGRDPLAPAVGAMVGAERGRIPSDVVLTPRFGFSHSERSHTRWSLDGGVGGFAGVPGLAPLAGIWSRTGSGELLLSCVGAAAPAPGWAAYAADPESTPSTCADGSSGFSDVTPAATVFDPAFRSPRTWRATLGASRGFTPRAPLRLEAALVHGRNLPTAAERNLEAVPSLFLHDEGGRSVYARPAQIDVRTGRIAPGAGRIDPALGPVVEVGSRGESWTVQLGASAGAPVGRRHRLSVQYAFTRSRILQSAIPAPGAPTGSTAGDPRPLEWAEAPYAPPHLFRAILAGSPSPRLSLVAIGELRSGIAFTPLVGGDVNGDGRTNDRAFLFDPASTADPELAAGMRRLMDDGPVGVRRCLRSGAGHIAAAGACRTPWSPSLDLRAEIRPWGTFNDRRFRLGVNLHNVTAGLDRLVHGPDRLRGWGQPAAPDPVLLDVRGFDPGRSAFLYRVNPGFGRTGSFLGHAPFRVVVQGRIALGADPRYQPLMAAVEAGMGRNRESVRAELSSRLVNAPGAVLQLHGTDTAALALTPAQRAFLRAAADSLAPLFTAAVDSLASAFTSAAAPPVRASRVQEAGRRLTVLQDEAIERTRRILTPEQWSRLPAWVTRPVATEELQRSPVFHVTM